MSTISTSQITSLPLFPLQHQHQLPSISSESHRSLVYPLPPELRCQYKTGKCMHPRTHKRNGKLHTLCEEHRLKQNEIQRKSDRKYQYEHSIRRKERRSALIRQHRGTPTVTNPMHQYENPPRIGWEDFVGLLEEINMDELLEEEKMKENKSPQTEKNTTTSNFWG